MYYGHSISFFLAMPSTYKNTDGTPDSQLIRLAWFHDKERAKAYLEKLLTIEKNKHLGLFLMENDFMFSKPIYEDDALELDKKPHDFGVRACGQQITISDH